MVQRDRKVIWNNICSTYGNSIWIHKGEKEGYFYSRIISREIVAPKEAWENPDDWDLFALLHEVGHVLTNTRKMKRCEQEYYATVWAIDEAKKRGVYVSKQTLQIYQEYIWRWRDKGLRMNGKDMPSNRDLLLVVNK